VVQVPQQVLMFWLTMLWQQEKVPVLQREKAQFL
jgi:hypothetical protein